MKKLLSPVIAAIFAFVSIGAFAADDSKADKMKPPEKRPPGKLPPRAEAESANSREAAAEMLKKFFNRR